MTFEALLSVIALTCGDLNNVDIQACKKAMEASTYSTDFKTYSDKFDTYVKNKVDNTVDTKNPLIILTAAGVKYRYTKAATVKFKTHILNADSISAESKIDSNSLSLDWKF